jgi:acyl-CoA thioester hydrolase
MVEHRKTFRVPFGDTDAVGIVFYPNYYRWFDQATHDLFRAAGYPVVQMLADGYAIPLVETQAQYRASLAYDDDVTLVSRVGEIRARTFRVEHMVSRGDTPICQGYEERIWVRILPEGGMAAEIIPDGVRALLDAD